MMGCPLNYCSNMFQCLESVAMSWNNINRCQPPENSFAMLWYKLELTRGHSAVSAPMWTVGLSDCCTRC